MNYEALGFGPHLARPGLNARSDFNAVHFSSRRQPCISGYPEPEEGDLRFMICTS